jgi:hypothetical protein
MPAQESPNGRGDHSARLGGDFPASPLPRLPLCFSVN